MESLPNEIITEIQSYLTRDDLFNFRILSKLFAESPIHTDHVIKVYRSRHRAKYTHTITLINNIRYAIDPNGNISHRQIGTDDVFYKKYSRTPLMLDLYANKKPKGNYSDCFDLTYTSNYIGNKNRYQLVVCETRNINKFFYLLYPQIEIKPSIKMLVHVEFGHV